jgi:hypothetical protein
MERIVEMLMCGSLGSYGVMEFGSYGVGELGSWGVVKM